MKMSFKRDNARRAMFLPLMISSHWEMQTEMQGRGGRPGKWKEVVVPRIVECLGSAELWSITPRFR